MNRLSPHEQNERRRAAKKKQKQAHRARVIVRMSTEQKEKERLARELDFKLRGLEQFAGCRSADRYAAVLRAKKGLL